MESVIRSLRYLNDHVLPYSAGYPQPGETVTCVRCRKEAISYYLGACFPGNWRGVHYHPVCFWKDMENGTNYVSPDLIYGLDTLSYGDQNEVLREVEKHEKLYTTYDKFIGRRLFNRVRGEILVLTNQQKIELKKEILVMKWITVSKVPEGARLFCCKCRKEITVGHLVIFYKKYFAHVKCSFECEIILGHLGDIMGYDELSPNQQSGIGRCFEERRTQEQPKIEGDHLCLFGSRRRVLVLSTACTSTSGLEPTKKVECTICSRSIIIGEVLFIVDNECAHPLCLFKSSPVIFETPEALPEWSLLTREQKKKMKREFVITSLNENTLLMTFPRPPPSQYMLDCSVGGERELERNPPARELERREQVTFMCRVREIMQSASDNVLNKFLIFNDQYLLPIRRQKIEQVVDIICVGVPKPCLLCKGSIVFNISRRRYTCTGYHGCDSETTIGASKCVFESRNPPRQVFKMPPEYPNMFSYEYNETKFRFYGGEQIRNRDSASIWIPPEIYELGSNKIPVDDLIVSNHMRRYTVIQGTAVPQHFGNFKNCHIHKNESTVYECLLAKVEVQFNLNSCCQIFVFEDDFNPGTFYVFQETYRIGMKVGVKQLYRHSNVKEALKTFKELFFNKTGKPWDQRVNEERTKVPGKFMFLELDKSGMTRDMNREELIMRRTMFHDFVLHRGVHSYATHSFLGKSSEVVVDEFESVVKNHKNAIMRSRETEDVKIRTTNAYYTAGPQCSGFETHSLIDLRALMDNNLKLNNNHDLNAVSNMHLHACEAMCVQMRRKFKEVPRNSGRYETVIRMSRSHFLPADHDPYKITDVIDVARVGEEASNLDGKKLLLWYSAELKSLEGILTHELGYRETENGRRASIYLTDCFAQSCEVSATKFQEFLLLCEVRLSNCHVANGEVTEEEVKRVMDDSSCDSIRRSGSFTPHSEMSSSSTSDAMEVDPIAFPFNEFVVFEKSRVKIKYLVRVEKSKPSASNF